jgi:hypothetical protein
MGAIMLKPSHRVRLRAQLAERGALVIAGRTDRDQLAAPRAKPIPQDAVQLARAVPVQLVDERKRRQLPIDRVRVGCEHPDPASKRVVSDLPLHNPQTFLQRGRPSAANPYNPSCAREWFEAWQLGWDDGDYLLDIRGQEEATRWLAAA